MPWSGVLVAALVASGCGAPNDPVFGLSAQSLSTNLEIHYINVGWGGAIFLKGPGTAGTTVLMEAGNTGFGSSRVVPYLQSIGYGPANGFDYTIAGHQHCDHIGGMDEVINAGYDVRVANYYNGSSYSSSCADEWNAASAGTTAGALQLAPVGGQIALGGGATLTFVARNGSIIGGGSVAVSDENDRSIAALIQYGGFDYLWASDLGGGSIDSTCTGRSTSQVDVETSVIRAISPGGAAPMISSGGIDVLHVNHHGSESSTNSNYMNLAQPQVAVIGVGAGESGGWDLPRVDVVEHVLLAQATACVTAPPAFVVQTEEGAPAGSLTSTAGYSVGNIKISTDGASGFTVSADGAVSEGPNEVAAAGLPRTFALDSGGGTGGDTQPPSVSITSPAAGATVSGTVSVSASASDNVGVTSVDFLLDGVVQASDASSPYAWSWSTAGVADGSHVLRVEAHDAAGNTGAASITVIVSNSGDTQPPTAPTNLTATSGSQKITLAWTASTDNVGVAGYQVWRSSSSSSGFNQIATTTSTSYADGPMYSGTKYFYFVKAFDAVGNVSAASATVKGSSH